MPDLPSTRPDLHNILGALADAVIGANHDGEIVYANSAVETLLGWPPNTLIGLPITILTPPRLRAAHLEGFERYRATGERHIIGTPTRLTARRRDGSEVGVELTISPVEGEPRDLFVVALLRKVREEIYAEGSNDVQLKRQLDLTRTITESLGEGVYALDRDGRVTFMNPAAQEMLGWREEELLGKDMHKIIHYQRMDGAHIGKDECPLLEVARTGVTHRSEDDVFTRKDGVLMPVSYTSSPIVTDGEIVGTVLAFRDMTETRRATAEMAAVLGQIADGIIMADVQGNITYINDAGQRILGESAIGTPVSEHTAVYHIYRLDGTPYPPEELPLPRAALQGETVLDAPVLIQLPGGRKTILDASATPLWSADGTRFGAVATFRDVTLHRELERQKDEFLSTAAHDLRTPLTTIKGLAQLLQRRMSRGGSIDPEKMRDSVDRIADTSARMAAMINDLLDLSRIQMGQALDLRRRPMDLVALVTRAVADQEQSAGGGRIHVDVSVPQLVGDWDADRLDRVFSNLLSNAVKYSPDGGDIEVRVAEEWTNAGREAIVTVADTGVGIPADDLPHIFERFHRGTNVASLLPGAGIGLAGVRQIVELHGGRIEVESREGEGSTFTVRLPADSAVEDTGAD